MYVNVFLNFLIYQAKLIYEKFGQFILLSMIVMHMSAP